VTATRFKGSDPCYVDLSEPLCVIGRDGNALTEGLSHSQAAIQALEPIGKRQGSARADVGGLLHDFQQFPWRRCNQGSKRCVIVVQKSPKNERVQSNDKGLLDSSQGAIAGDESGAIN
jgi:hypothetical protein